MRKVFTLIFCLVLGLPFASAQPKPAFGNINFSAGISFGQFYAQTSSPRHSLWSNYPKNPEFINELATCFFLGLEKHHSRWFSMNHEYGFTNITRPNGSASSHHITIAPFVNFRSPNRFSFSFGVGVTGGLYSNILDNSNFWGVSPSYRLRILLGKSDTFRTKYKGEFLICMEPFYFINGKTRAPGAYRRLRVQFNLPLTK